MSIGMKNLQKEERRRVQMKSEDFVVMAAFVSRL